MRADMAGVTLDQGQIARIAGVSRAAVGNWKSRHEDFPLPDSSGRFEFLEIEDWLINKAKIRQRVDVGEIIWALADALRDSGLSPEESLDAIQAVAVYLAVNEGRSFNGEVVELPSSLRWSSLRAAGAEELAARLLDVVDSQAFTRSGMDQLVRSGFEQLRVPAPNVVRGLIDAVSQVASDPDGLLDLVDSAASRMRSADRFAAEFATPESLREVMLAVAGDIHGTVVDLACGEGGLLAAVHSAPGRRPVRLIGVEVNAGAIETARRNLLIAQVEAELRHVDALVLGPDDMPSADLVLLDPPFGQKEWGDADLYVDPKWQHGAPPPKSSEFAWLQLALLALGSTGRAVVVLPASLRSRRGREGDIRQSVVQSGLLEAVVSLPPRMRLEHSVPSDLWVLSNDANRVTRDAVLFIDASDRGHRGRATTTLAPEENEWIEQLITAWREQWWEADEISWSATFDEIASEGWVLEPKRYKPTPQLNWHEEWARADELRRSLEEGVPDVAQALTALARATLLRDQEVVLTPLDNVFDLDRGATRIGKIVGDEGPLRRVVTRESLGSGVAESVPAAVVEGKDVTVRRGDFVLTVVGNAVGVALADESWDGLPATRDCLMLRPKSDRIYAPWFLAWFQSTHFQHQIERVVAGSVIRRVALRHVSELTVPVMPDDEHLRAEVHDLARAQATLRSLESSWHEFIDLATDLLFVEDLRQDWSELLGGEDEQ